MRAVGLWRLVVYGTEQRAEGGLAVRVQVLRAPACGLQTLYGSALGFLA